MLPESGNEWHPAADYYLSGGSLVVEDEADRVTPLDHDEECPMAISRDQVEKLRALLRAAPQAPAGSVDTTKQQAVRLLAGEIQSLQRRGYTLEQVGEMLKGGGLVLTPPTLKSYLSRAKARRKLSRGTRGKATPFDGPKAAAEREKIETAPVATPAARQGSRAHDAETPGVNTGPGRRDAADGSPLRTGKDAFLIKDKDSY